MSSHAQGCDDIEDQLSAKALGRKICGAKNDVRMNYHACMSLFGSTRDAKEGFRRLTAEVSRTFGCHWKFTTRGFMSKARQETERGFKRGKVARREGYHCAVDRNTRDDIHRKRVISNGVDFETMQE